MLFEYYTIQSNVISEEIILFWISQQQGNTRISFVEIYPASEGDDIILFHGRIRRTDFGCQREAHVVLTLCDSPFIYLIDCFNT